VAIQGTVSRTCEVSILAFDTAKGSGGVVDLSAITDIELLQAGGHSLFRERRKAEVQSAPSAHQPSPESLPEEEP
jgi:hypothetical protein